MKSIILRKGAEQVDRFEKAEETNLWVYAIQQGRAVSTKDAEQNEGRRAIEASNIILV